MLQEKFDKQLKIKIVKGKFPISMMTSGFLIIILYILFENNDHV